MKILDKQVVLITGGAGGIGKATAELFLENGAAVVLVDLKQEALDVAAQTLPVAKGELLTITADVTNEQDVERYVQETVDKFGVIDVFFNNAGISGPFQMIKDLDQQQFDLLMKINVTGVFLGEATILFDGTEQVYTKGMAHYCQKGHGHSISNKGVEDLVTFNVVAPQ